MPRDITNDFKTAATAEIVYPLFLHDFVFDEGEINLFTGRGELVWDGVTYHGSGALLAIDPAEETQDLEAKSCGYVLAAPPSIVSLAMTADYQGRPVRSWLGLLDASGALIADPVRFFSGKMDTMPIEPDPVRPTIALTAENDLVLLNRTKERRYTHEDHQLDYPGDMFFEFVPGLQDKEVTF